MLGLLATDWLYANSPSEEGDMSARRQHMVSASALCAAVAGKGFVAMLKRNKGAGELPETAKTVADAVEAGDLERYEKKLYGMECMQCGCCTYICPAKRPLMQIFKQAKTEIMARKRAEAAGGKK